MTVLLAGLLLVLAEITAVSHGGMITLRRPRKTVVVEWHVVGMAVVFILLFVVPAVIESLVGQRVREKATDNAVVFAIVANFVILAAVIPLLAVTGRNSLSDYGIDGRQWLGERFGGLGFLIAMPFVIVVLEAMASWRGPQTEHPYLKLLATGNDWAIIGVAFAAVVAAPLMEELIFRVIFQGLLESLVRPWAAILFPAIAFAAMHGKYNALPLLPLALVLESSTTCGAVMSPSLRFTRCSMRLSCSWPCPPVRVPRKACPAGASDRRRRRNLCISR